MFRYKHCSNAGKGPRSQLVSFLPERFYTLLLLLLLFFFFSFFNIYLAALGLIDSCRTQDFHCGIWDLVP